jgi:hypothetical protein
MNLKNKRDAWHRESYGKHQLSKLGLSESECEEVISNFTTYAETPCVVHRFYKGVSYSLVRIDSRDPVKYMVVHNSSLVDA